MSKTPISPSDVIIDGLRITPDLVSNLKDLLDPDAKYARNCIARNCLFIASIPGDNEEIDRDFFNLQRIFYNILTSLDGEVDNAVGGPR